MKHRLLFALVVIVCLSLLVSLPALAAKAQNGGSGSSISLVPLDDTARTTSWPGFGAQVTFAVSTSRTEYPWVQNRCWQDGKLVLEQWHGFFAGYQFGQVFTLGPTPSWAGGDATCTARLLRKANGRYQTLATTSYSVTG